MKKTKKKKAIRPFCFLQDTGIFPVDLPVFVNCKTKEDVRKLLVKIKAKKNVIAFSEKISDKAFECSGAVVHSKDDEQIYLFLLLKNIDIKTWLGVETLVHELHHATAYIAGEYNTTDEMESCAYLQEHLFREIRMKFNGSRKHKRWYL